MPLYKKKYFFTFDYVHNAIKSYEITSQSVMTTPKCFYVTIKFIPSVF